jgi:hypothetical protein
MIQRTERGKQARQYFLAVEKAWNSPEKIMERALQIAHRRAEEAERRILALAQTVEADKPKVLFADAVSASNGTVLIGELAKILKGNGAEIGQNRLYERLRREGYHQAQRFRLQRAHTESYGTWFVQGQRNRYNPLRRTHHDEPHYQSYRQRTAVFY